MQTHSNRHCSSHCCFKPSHRQHKQSSHLRRRYSRVFLYVLLTTVTCIKWILCVSALSLWGWNRGQNFLPLHAAAVTQTPQTSAWNVVLTFNFHPFRFAVRAHVTLFILEPIWPCSLESMFNLWENTQCNVRITLAWRKFTVDFTFRQIFHAHLLSLCDIKRQTVTGEALGCMLKITSTF